MNRTWPRRRPGRAMVGLLAVPVVAVVVLVVRGAGAENGAQAGTRWRLQPGVADQRVENVYTTGYTWFDNTPPGSGRISHPVVHRRAGGTGSYDDPVTLAVGHSRASGRDVLDVPAGTRFYVPQVRRYFVVEDSCGDGERPEAAGCHDLGHAPSAARLWVDLYIGGSADDARSEVQRCAGTVTDGSGPLHVVIVNPGRDYAVVTGPLYQDGACARLYPEGPVTTGG